MILKKNEGLTFDDVLLEPQRTDIESRSWVSTTTRFTNDYLMRIPIISANMDTVTEAEMMAAMWSCGGQAILHRFMPPQEVVRQVNRALDMSSAKMGDFVAVSVGIADGSREYFQYLLDHLHYNFHVVCIDVAHGHTSRVERMIRFIAERAPHLSIIAGNVATPQATKDLCEAGVDAVKVGIGPGSLCTTRVITGCGVPQLTAIMDCAEVARRYNIPVIADGGIRNSGDIVKALAAGASSVMLGNLFSATDESPNKVVVDSDFQVYRGMASRNAMDSWKGDKARHTTPEGEMTLIPKKGSVIPIVESLVAGVRSGMTYCDAMTIEELYENAIFRVVSSSTARENGVHGIFA